MKFKETPVGARIPEILANDHWAAIPRKIAFGAGVTLVKAGTPIADDGTVATGADVLGILLWDVTPENPNGTLIYHGRIETQRAQSWSGVTITQAMKDALPQIAWTA